MTTNFFSPLSFVAVFGSGIRDGQKSGSGIRDKHPGSATLGTTTSILQYKLQYLYENRMVPLIVPLSAVILNA
jgi:hypothetical protein